MFVTDINISDSFLVAGLAEDCLWMGAQFFFYSALPKHDAWSKQVILLFGLASIGMLYILSRWLYKDLDYTISRMKTLLLSHR